tara:strand:+ start:367 stop:573 length:207 start_codon:yes stop_codon:yes gene_type:complete
MNHYKIRHFSTGFTERLPERGRLGRVFLYGTSIQIAADGTAFLVLNSGVRRELTDEANEALQKERPDG